MYEARIVICLLLLLVLFAAVLTYARSKTVPFFETKESEIIINLCNDVTSVEGFKTGDILLCSAGDASFIRKSLMAAPFTHVALLHYNEEMKQMYVFHWNLKVCYIPLKRYVSAFTSVRRGCGEVFHWPINRAFEGSIRERLDYYVQQMAPLHTITSSYLDEGIQGHEWELIDKANMRCAPGKTIATDLAAWSVGTGIAYACNDITGSQLNTGTIGLCTDFLVTLFENIGALDMHKWINNGHGRATGIGMTAFDYRNGILNRGMKSPYRYASHVRKCVMC